MSLGISAIDHVQIAVPRSLETEALAFYREVLELSEIPKPEELRARGGGWFQTGNLQLHIGVDPDSDGPPPPRSKRHVCFLVPDLAAAKAAVVAKGVAIEEESIAEGLSRFFIRDPAGNRIEIGMRV